MQNKGQFGKNASDLPFVGLSFNPVFPNHGNPPLHHHLDSTKANRQAPSYGDYVLASSRLFTTRGLPAGGNLSPKNRGLTDGNCIVVKISYKSKSFCHFDLKILKFLHFWSDFECKYLHFSLMWQRTDNISLTSLTPKSIWGEQLISSWKPGPCLRSNNFLCYETATSLHIVEVILATPRSPTTIFPNVTVA